MEKYIWIICPTASTTFNRSSTTFTIDCYIIQLTQLKQMTTCSNAQTTISQTVDSQKTTYTYLQNVQEYKKHGRTIKPYLQNW